MKTCCFAVIACLLPLAAPAQTAAIPPKIPAAGRTLAAFTPKNYGPLPDGQATGDLNHDGRPDVALVLRPLAENNPEVADTDPTDRILLLLFSTPTGYQLAARSDQVVLCKQCGGLYGDPFAGISIVKGVLRIEHYGGSSWRWRVVSTFRYQQNDFYLIGETKDSGRSSGDCENISGPPSWDYRDTNFLTGEYEVWKNSEDCKLLVHRRGKEKVRALRKLTAYSAQ